MFALKDKFYYYAVDRNKEIRDKYHAFVDADPEKHRKSPLRSYWYLLQLNFTYRVLRWLHIRNDASSPKGMPYLDGAESSLKNRPAPICQAHACRDYDLISFDIFDTLILRPLSVPADLFFLVGKKLGLLKFREIRMVAECEARQISFAKHGHNEVTIYDIYERVAAMTGIDPETGVKAEFETELDLCYANPFMLEYVKSFRADRKRIVAVSDMYLPKNLMLQLLEKCGYRNFDDVIVSCDHNCSKRGGALFRVLKSKYPDAEKILHFGDNSETDCQGAEAAGIDHYFYRSVCSCGYSYRPVKMSELIKSAYSGIVNAHLHNGKFKYSIPYEFGFIYGGIYLLGYCRWIHEYCVRNKVDKILFLSRDGEITRKVFQLLYDDIATEYFYWSRSATVRYCMDSGFRYYAVNRIVDDNEWTRNDSDTSATIRQMFEQFKLPPSLYNHLADYQISENDTIISQRMNLKRLFFDHASEISCAYDEEAEVLKEYLTQVIGDSRHLALVDVGRTGGTPFGLRRFIEKNIDPEIKSSILLSVYGESHDQWIQQGEELNVYICSNEHNRDILLEFNEQKVFRYSCFETFHEALHPSFHHLEMHDGELSFSFASPEFENYPMIREMQKGILDFCRIYRDSFRNYPYMLNISGADAIAPYRLLMPYVTAFMTKWFPDYVRTHYTPFNIDAQPLLYSELLKSAGIE